MLRILSHLEEGAIMVRLVTTVLALAILPGFAVAQEPDPQALVVGLDAAS